MQNNQIPTTLAIDFGTKRVGLAVSRATLADPLLTLANDDTLFEKLQEICQQEEVAQVVVGISEQKMAELTEQFVTELKRHLDLPILTADETLTSQTAESKLRSTVRGRRQAVIDHFAAAEILQAWLDEQDV
jgi:putative transcription antitermination factor YqgF